MVQDSHCSFGIRVVIELKINHARSNSLISYLYIEGGLYSRTKRAVLLQRCRMASRSAAE